MNRWLIIPLGAVGLAIAAGITGGGVLAVNSLTGDSDVAAVSALGPTAIVLDIKEPEKQVLTGEFTLNDEDIIGTGDHCFGTGGYDDFGPGMNVTVRDGNGSIIASGDTVSSDAFPDNYSCTVEFAVEVDDVEFYAIEVGHRGELSYSKEELEEQGWNVSLVLG